MVLFQLQLRLQPQQPLQLEVAAHNLSVQPALPFLQVLAVSATSPATPKRQPEEHSVASAWPTTASLSRLAPATVPNISTLGLSTAANATAEMLSLQAVYQPLMVDAACLVQGIRTSHAVVHTV